MTDSQNFISFTTNKMFTSYDGNNIVVTLADGSLYIRFHNGNRYGIGYLNDPYKNSMHDKRESSMGFKYVAVNKNNIALAKSTDHLYIATFDMINLKNIEQVDDNLKKGNPSINWECKVNPYKKDNEMYKTIIFIDDNNISLISEYETESNLYDYNIYIYNLKTDCWKKMNDIEDTDTFNFIGNPMLFFLDNRELTNNFTAFCIDNDKIGKKTLTLEDITNIACSRQTKMLSKFNSTTNVLQILPYQNLFVGNIEWEEHLIKFSDDKEFYTTHNISENAYIVATNKNVYIKLIGTDEWIKAIFDSKDVYTIYVDDEEYDKSNIIWSNILVHEDKVVLVSLVGNTYYLKYTEDFVMIINTQLPPIYCNDKIFNIMFDKIKFYNKYKILYKKIE